MAIRKSKSSAGRFKPKPEDAIRLAALQWYALTINRVAIEIYATRPDRFRELSALLRNTIKHMNAFAEHDTGDEDGCPDGYTMCSDGFCAPMCDVEMDREPRS